MHIWFPVDSYHSNTPFPWGMFNGENTLLQSNQFWLDDLGQTLQTYDSRQFKNCLNPIQQKWNNSWADIIHAAHCDCLTAQFKLYSHMAMRWGWHGHTASRREMSAAWSFLGTGISKSWSMDTSVPWEGINLTLIITKKLRKMRFKKIRFIP